MFRRIYRQRRRLLLSAFFVALATFATLSRHPDILDVGQATWMIQLTFALTGIVIGAIYALLGVLIVLILPDWRGLLEILSATFFVDAILAFALPGYFGLDSDSDWAIFTWMIIYFSLWSMIFGRALDRFRFVLGYKATRSYLSSLAPEDIWKRRVLGQCPIGEYYDPLLADVTPVPDDANSYEVSFRHGGGFFDQQTVTYTQMIQGQLARSYFQGEVNSANRSITEGIWEMRLELHKTGKTRVTLHEHRPSMLPREALHLWFDDHLGDSADRQRALDGRASDWSLSGRYRRIVLKYA